MSDETELAAREGEGQWTQCRAHLRAVVAKSFSPEARIMEVAWQSSLQLVISWRLGADSKRTNTRSKTVRLTIDARTLDDYAAAPEVQRQRADARLGELIEQRLVLLDPSANSLVVRDVPIMRWCISSAQLFG